MKIINVLTRGFETPNGTAFIYPLLYFKRELLDSGFRFNLFYKLTPQLYDCDILWIDSKYFKDMWQDQSDQAIEILQRIKSKVKLLIYFDTTDSSGFLLNAVLPFVDKYLKGQIYKDKTLYQKEIYANRLYCDYYNQKYNIEDNEPLFSSPINRQDLLEKIGISWNSGLSDYTVRANERLKICNILKSPLKITPKHIAPPSVNRPVDIVCRMGINYPRETVCFQRRKMASRYVNPKETIKLKRRKYIREMRNAKITLSPFGFGEITLKDFEVFLAGSLLVKPDMNHMITWPNYFEPNSTMITHNWDLSDLDDLLKDTLDNYQDLLEVARNGQRQYLRYLTNPEFFVKKIQEINSN